MDIEHFLEQATPDWMHTNSENDDIVISTRIRLARNLINFRFPICFSEDEALQIDRVISNVFTDNESLPNTFSYFPIHELTILQRKVLVEKHLISPQLARKENVGAVLLSEDESISVLVNEEDHLRIQCLTPGLRIMSAYTNAEEIDQVLEEELPYAYHDDFGYLTSCPTNIGTGLRASVMMHLPALTSTNQMSQLINAMTRLGMTVRGIYGEGSENLGNIYQVSNQITLGKTEDDILKDLQSVAEKIIQKERQARKALIAHAPMVLEDRIHRSLGTLTSARIIASEEAATCLSNVWLGVDLGIIRGISKATLMDCMIIMQQGFLQLKAGMDLQPDERDLYRAKMLREALLLHRDTAHIKLGEKGEKPYDV